MLFSNSAMTSAESKRNFKMLNRIKSITGGNIKVYPTNQVFPPTTSEQKPNLLTAFLSVLFMSVDIRSHWTETKLLLSDKL